MLRDVGVFRLVFMMEECVTVMNFPKEGSPLVFMERFLLGNQPCLFGKAWTEGWKARKLWLTSAGKPNLDYLSSEFGVCMLYIPPVL